MFSANRTLVPIRCRVVQDLEDFDGSWTVCHSIRTVHTQTDVVLFKMWESEFLLSLYPLESCSNLPEAGLIDVLGIKVCLRRSHHIVLLTILLRHMMPWLIMLRRLISIVG